MKRIISRKADPEGGHPVESDTIPEFAVLEMGRCRAREVGLPVAHEHGFRAVVGPLVLECARHDPEVFEHGPEDDEFQARGSDSSWSSTPAGRRGPRHQRPHDERLEAELGPSLIFSVCASLDRQLASTIAIVM